MTEDSDLTTDEEAVDWPPTDGDAVNVADRGVRVRKWVTERGAAVPVVNYDIASMRDEPVTLELRDTTPEDLSGEDVGFHEDFEAENWRRVDENEIAYRRRLDPGESVTTVYGVRRSSLDDREAFLERPTLSVTTEDEDGPGPVEETAEAVPTLDVDDEGDIAMDEGDAESIEEAAAEVLDLDDPDSDPGAEPMPPADATEAATPAEDDQAEEPEEPAAFGSGLDLSGADDLGIDDDEPALGDLSLDEGPDADSAAPGADSDSDSDANVGRTQAGASVAADLAREFRTDSVDEDDRDAIAQELNLELSESTAAFLDRLRDRANQRRERLERDIEDLESSITEVYGLKADAADLQQTRADLSALAEQKADESDLAVVTEAVEALEDAKAEADRLDDVAERLDTLVEDAATDERVDDVVARLDDLDEAAARADALEDLADEVDALDHRSATVRGLAEAERDLARLDDIAARAEALAALEDRVDALDDDLETLREEREDATAELREDLETSIADAREDLSADLADARSEFENDLEAVRREREAATGDLRDDVEADLEAVQSDLEADVVDLRESTDDDVQALHDLLEDEYVTERTVDDVIVQRVDNSLRALLLLALGSGGVLLSFVLAATGAASLALSAFVLGAVVLGGWWYLQPGGLASGIGDGDDAVAPDAGAESESSADDDPVEAPDEEEASADEEEPAPDVDDDSPDEDSATVEASDD
ncbi:hypothetical protein [Haloarchaeobius amylolyticus]|uniref:hypothetical protein n=1 Tax=Haloarchaeobius amylolyticus TaxID=1198296 RepID=UPI00226F09A8|nr:hypothetical protein [Haloarchaeobius amylolyticus]